MMSLFSSFDVFYFPYQSILLFTLGILLMSNFMISKFNVVKCQMIYNLEKFFSSLKHKSVNLLLPSVFISVFFMIFCLNFLSIFPYIFPFTTLISIVLTSSFMFWAGLILFFMIYNINNLLMHAIPENSPLYLASSLLVVELVSNVIRPITLSVRLFANILAGHLLMILLCNLVYDAQIFFVFYLTLNLAEFMVAAIQAYIFTTMSALYYSEVN